MAFATYVNWEVRTTGSDSNGGGFDATSGTPGTDYSQQDSPQIVYSDLVIDGTTNTKCTSAGNPFTSAHVGNIINVTGGTGFTVQRVQIMSVTAGAATVDKSLGTLGSTGGTGNLGGALQTLATVAGLYVAGNTIWIKNTGTYTLTSTVTWGTSGTTNGLVKVVGYNTTRWEVGNAPTITTATNSVHLFRLTGNRVNFYNLKFTSTAAIKAAAIHTDGNIANRFINCIFDGLQYGIYKSNTGLTPSVDLHQCTIQNCVSNGISVYPHSSVSISKSLIVNNGGHGVYGGGGASFSAYCSIFARNTGDGFQAANSSHGRSVSYRQSIFAYNTGHGASIGSDATGEYQLVEGCVFFGNGGWGLTDGGGGGNIYLMTAYIERNAYGKNTSGNRNIGSLCSGLTVGDVDLGTNDPFVDKDSLNFTLKANTALRNAGFPGTYHGQTATVGYMDLGATQEQMSSGGIRNMDGGFN